MKVATKSSVIFYISYAQWVDIGLNELLKNVGFNLLAEQNF